MHQHPDHLHRIVDFLKNNHMKGPPQVTIARKPRVWNLAVHPVLEPGLRGAMVSVFASSSLSPSASSLAVFLIDWQIGCTVYLQTKIR